MSGHSKWANIKRQKQANDFVRGNIFAKLSKAITLAVLENGGVVDPAYNFRLRLEIEKAKESNMPKENIKRAIEKGIGPNKMQIKEVFFEAYAPAGVALIIHALTDNINRTTAEIRNVLEKYHGKLGTQGSVTYMFQRCGLVVFNKKDTTEENIMMIADAVHFIDLDQDETHYFLYVPFEHLGKIKDEVQTTKYESAELDFKPQTIVPVLNEENSKKLINLISSLEGLDEVHKVFGNFDIPDEYFKHI
ncbi:MAG: YebC/PmpR family DNA-binding transcriptional regulator [bacterium]|nr:YebC/PmpR family DNA-binding transcriptional regulator [bacterium]